MGDIYTTFINARQQKVERQMEQSEAYLENRTDQPPPCDLTEWEDPESIKIKRLSEKSRMHEATKIKTQLVTKADNLLPISEDTDTADYSNIWDQTWRDFMNIHDNIQTKGEHQIGQICKKTFGRQLAEIPKWKMAFASAILNWHNENKKQSPRNDLTTCLGNSRNPDKQEKVGHTTITGTDRAENTNFICKYSYSRSKMNKDRLSEACPLCTNPKCPVNERIGEPYDIIFDITDEDSIYHMGCWKCEYTECPANIIEKQFREIHKEILTPKVKTKDNSWKQPRSDMTQGYAFDTRYAAKQDSLPYQITNQQNRFTHRNQRPNENHENKNLPHHIDQKLEENLENNDLSHQINQRPNENHKNNNLPQHKRQRLEENLENNNLPRQMNQRPNANYENKNLPHHINQRPEKNIGSNNLPDQINQMPKKNLENKNLPHQIDQKLEENLEKIKIQYIYSKKAMKTPANSETCCTVYLPKKMKKFKGKCAIIQPIQSNELRDSKTMTFEPQMIQIKPKFTN